MSLPSLRAGVKAKDRAAKENLTSSQERSDSKTPGVPKTAAGGATIIFFYCDAYFPRER
jgi:hypothetical protein